MWFHLPTWFSSYWYFFGWRDACEITFFSSIIYWFSVWLKHDRQHNLVLPFYWYLGTFIIAHHLTLTTVSNFLWVCSPIAAMLLIVVHQETLQKNMVMLRNITPKVFKQHDWLKLLMSSALKAVNNNHHITCIIEKQDSLAPLLEAPFKLNTDVDKNLLDLFLESSFFDATKMIWVTSNGKLVAVNATWQRKHDQAWATDEVKKCASTKQDALFYTHKTDALVLHVSPITSTFEIICQGKVMEDVPSHHAFNMINRYMQSSSQTEGVTHAPFNKKHRSNEHNA